MDFRETELEGVFEVHLKRHVDERGWFARAVCEDEFADAGLVARWVQVNQGYSTRAGTLRGIHFQRSPHEDAKYVRCIAGSVLDVAVDLREGSDRYGEWVARELSADNGVGLYIPAGFGHGYQTMEPDTMIMYWTDQRYAPTAATGVRYDDPQLGITWPTPPSVISDQDASWPLMSDQTDR